MADNLILRESPAKYIEWNIQNVLEHEREDKFKMESPCFRLSGAEWYLTFIPLDSHNLLSDGWIGLYLNRKGSVAEHRVAFKFGIRKLDGSDFEAAEEYLYTFNKVKVEQHGTDELIHRSQLHRVKNHVFPNGTLTIFCFIRIMNELLASPANLESASQTDSDDISSLSEDFKNVYINRRSTDVTLIVKDKEFFAHKTVLITRSPVFASMFEHDLSEKRSGKVEISDCDPDSFEEFLLFLYTGKLDNVSLEKAVDIYKTADKYDVKDAKEGCAHIMRRNLCIDFFCDVMYLAIMHNEMRLLKISTNFFIDNAEEILLTTKWQTFMENNSSVCIELLLKLARSKKLEK